MQTPHPHSTIPARFGDHTLRWLQELLSRSTGDSGSSGKPLSGARMQLVPIPNLLCLWARNLVTVASTSRQSRRLLPTASCSCRQARSLAMTWGSGTPKVWGEQSGETRQGGKGVALRELLWCSPAFLPPGASPRSQAIPKGAAPPGEQERCAGTPGAKEPSREGMAWEMGCWRKRKETPRTAALCHCACWSLSQFLLELPSFNWPQPHEDAVASVKQQLHKSPKDPSQILTSSSLGLPQLHLLKKSLGIGGIFPK